MEVEVSQTRAVAVRSREQDLKPTDLDNPIKRSTGALNQALDTWDAIHPLVSEFLSAVGVEVRKGLAGESERAHRHDPKTGTVYEVQYMDRDGEEVTKDVWMRDVARDLVVWVEKLSRAFAALTKTVDEAARLQEFLSGGPDSRPDLSNASDGELIETLIEVVLARGLMRHILKRARERGIEVDVG
jgi:hypothetical protein